MDRRDPELAAVPVLHADVLRAAGVVADEHRAEAGNERRGAERSIRARSSILISRKTALPSRTTQAMGSPPGRWCPKAPRRATPTVPVAPRWCSTFASRDCLDDTAHARLSRCGTPCADWVAFTIATLLLVGAGAVPARRAGSEPTGRRHPYRRVRVRYRRVPRGEQSDPQPADRRHGRHRIRRWLLVGRVGRRRVRVRRRAVLRFDGWTAC